MSSSIRPDRPWFEKWPTDLTSVFSSEQATENAQYLMGKIKWLRKAIDRQRAHPLVSAWIVGSTDQFIMLNTLAEDMRALDSKPHFNRLLDDMARPKEFGPAIHTLHMAALFERGGNPVTEFLDAKNDRIPDFITSIAGTETAIEAKMLTASESSRRFAALGFATLERLKMKILVPAGVAGRFFFVCKDAANIPQYDLIAEGLTEILRNFDGRRPVHACSALINIFAEPVAENAVFDDIRELQWVCRRSDEEDFRIERILRSANKQIKAWTRGQRPGVACVSINEHQDPIALRQFVERKFANEQYTSTSGMLLHRTARHVGSGPLGPVDLLSIIGNPWAAVPVGEVTLKSFGVTARLDENLPPADTLSCYCFAHIEGRIHNVGGNGGLYLDPVVRLPTSMFA